MEQEQETKIEVKVEQEKQEKVSFCCEVVAVEVDGEWQCTECHKKCKLQPREWRWWEKETVDKEGNVTYEPTIKVAALKQAYAIGASDKEACVYAEISLQQLYYFQRLHPKFTREKQLLKEKPVLAARQTVIKAIQGFKMNVLDKQGNFVEVEVKPNDDLAMRYLERRADELKPKLDISGGISISERDYVLEEALKKATPEQREVLLNAITEIHKQSNI